MIGEPNPVMRPLTTCAELIMTTTSHTLTSNTASINHNPSILRAIATTDNIDSVQVCPYRVLALQQMNRHMLTQHPT